VLAYCIAEQKSQIQVPSLGVEEAPVRSIDMGTLRCFVSDFGAHAPHEPVPEMVKAFNRVLQQIFAQAGIIPFRFPTIVEGEDVLRKFIESRAAEYSRALDRLRNKVQMDVRISLGTDTEAANTASQSGKSYLELKRDSYLRVQSIAEEFQRVSGSLAEKWVQRDTPTGIRGFALVDRSSLSVFLEKLGRVHTPPGISARITGPWPPSEFVEAADE
jgi:hypothetical protein